MRHFNYYTPFILQKIGYVIFFLLYKVFVRLEVKGRENLVGLTGPIVLAANHTHELDATAIPLALPFFSTFFPVYFVANKTEKYKTFGWRGYIYGGTFFNMLGGYSVYSGQKDYAISLEDHIKILEMGNTLCIFPEGKRTRDGHMNPGRGGLGYLAYTTQATVVPVAIDTFFNMGTEDFFTFKRRVVLTVGKPMFPNEIVPIANPQVEDFQQGSQKVLDRIKGMLSE